MVIFQRSIQSHQRLVSTVLVCAVTVFTLVIAAMPASATAEESMDQSDRYTSVRGSVYKKTIRRFDEHGYGARFKLQLSTMLYRYKSFDDLLNPQTTHFNSVGIRPVFQLTYPTMWEHVRFIPTAEVQLTRRFDLDKYLLSGSVSGMLRYENDINAGFLTTYGSLKYGTRYDSDGLNQEDYVRLKFKAALDRSLGWSIKEHTQHIVPFVSASYFFNDFQFGDNQGNFTDMDAEYELGIQLASKPRMKIGKVRVPELQFSIVIADDVTGFKIRF